MLALINRKTSAVLYVRLLAEVPSRCREWKIARTVGVYLTLQEPEAVEHIAVLGGAFGAEIDEFVTCSRSRRGSDFDHVRVQQVALVRRVVLLHAAPVCRRAVPDLLVVFVGARMVVEVSRRADHAASTRGA